MQSNIIQDGCQRQILFEIIIMEKDLLTVELELIEHNNLLTGFNHFDECRIEKAYQQNMSAILLEKDKTEVHVALRIS